MNQYSVQLLSGFAVRNGDRTVILPPACRRLIALTALKRKPVHRLWVCATLWPHVQTRKAVANLRSTLWRLRPLGLESVLCADPQYLRLGSDVSVDWHRSVDLIERLGDGGITPQLVAELLPLLRAGELLDRWDEPWVAAERSRYHVQRMTALETLGHGAETRTLRTAGLRRIVAHAGADRDGENLR